MIKEINNIEVGTIIYFKTCDEIRMDLKGNTKRINEHEVPYLVETIKVDRCIKNNTYYKSTKYYLFNLINQKRIKAYKNELIYLLENNRIRISKERG